MAIKFSEELVPLADLKVDPGRVVRHATEAHRPVLLTSRGRRDPRHVRIVRVWRSEWLLHLPAGGDEK